MLSNCLFILYTISVKRITFARWPCWCHWWCHCRGNISGTPDLRAHAVRTDSFILELAGVKQPTWGVAIGVKPAVILRSISAEFLALCQWIDALKMQLCGYADPLQSANGAVSLTGHTWGAGGAIQNIYTCYPRGTFTCYVFTEGGWEISRFCGQIFSKSAFFGTTQVFQ